MARVLFKRGTTEEIEKLPTEDGSFIVDTEKGKSYTDVGDKRIPVGSAGNEVVIGDESKITEDTKLFINPDEVLPQGNDVVDSLEGNETDKAPSVRAVKEGLKDVYSTEEQVIGTYLGKPLYRRVINGAFELASHWLYLDVSEWNIKKYVNIHGSANMTSNVNTRIQPIPRVVPDNISGYGIGIGDIETSRITIIFGTNYTKINELDLTIEYTKTTD